MCCTTDLVKNLESNILDNETGKLIKKIGCGNRKGGLDGRGKRFAKEEN